MTPTTVPARTATGRTLVAGVGNVFLGDDGFGVAVARQLARSVLPDGIEVADFGIRGVHLVYELLNGYDTLVLIDAMRNGEEPGTLTLLDAGSVGVDRGPSAAQQQLASTPALDGHSMHPAAVLSMLAGLNARIERVLVLACEPAEIEATMELSPEVARAVPAAVAAIEELVGISSNERSSTKEEGRAS